MLTHQLKKVLGVFMEVATVLGLDSSLNLTSTTVKDSYPLRWELERRGRWTDSRIDSNCIRFSENNGFFRRYGGLSSLLVIWLNFAGISSIGFFLVNLIFIIPLLMSYIRW
jgi:hypothetical protein